ncbi:MAG: hypothetical protein ACETWQ_14685, partial [Phycisphaerae bacterium]
FGCRTYPFDRLRHAPSKAEGAGSERSRRIGFVFPFPENGKFLIFFLYQRSYVNFCLTKTCPELVEGLALFCKKGAICRGSSTIIEQVSCDLISCYLAGLHHVTLVPWFPYSALRHLSSV